MFRSREAPQPWPIEGGMLAKIFGLGLRRLKSPAPAQARHTDTHTFIDNCDVSLGGRVIIKWHWERIIYLKERFSVHTKHSRTQTQLPECIGKVLCWCHTVLMSAAPIPCVPCDWSAMLRSQSKLYQLHSRGSLEVMWHEAVYGLVGQLHLPGNHGVIGQWYNMEFEEWSSQNWRIVRRLIEENSSWIGL